MGNKLKRLTLYKFIQQTKSSGGQSFIYVPNSILERWGWDLDRIVIVKLDDKKQQIIITQPKESRNE